MSPRKIKEETAATIVAERQATLRKRSAANEATFHSNASDAGLGAAWTDRLCQSGSGAADMAEVMSALEDLWLRMARHPAMRVAVQGDPLTGESMVLIRVVAPSLDREGCHLLGAATDLGSYRWSQGGSKGSLASDVRWIASTLVIELKPLDQMRRWPLGDALAPAMQALLQRVKHLGTCA